MFDKALFDLPGIKRVLASLALLAALQAACIIGQALLLASALTNLWNGATLDTQLGLIGGFLACFIARQACTTAQDAALSRYAYRQSTRLREQLLQTAFCGQAGWVRNNGTGHVTTAALEGLDQVENYLKVILPKTIAAGIVLPATLVTSFILDWPSGIILLVVLPVIIFYMIMLGRMAQERATSQYGVYQRLSNHFLDTVRGLPTLKVFGAAKRHAAEIFKVSEQFREATVKTLRVATLSSVTLDMIATLGVAAVAMILGFRLVVGQADLFTGMAMLIIAPEYFAPLRQFAGDFHASLDGRNALADVLALVGNCEGVPAPSEDAEPKPWDANSTLELHGIGFTYPSKDGDLGNAALKDISLTATGFTRIGIVGPSGSGKSTLANLLGGFIVPDAGTVSIDGTTLPPDGLAAPAWQRQVLYIPQNPHIFHATLRDNIAFYTPNATDAEIQAAIRTVGLDELVAELPEGMHTIVGEGGRKLSGGQAHRIALARAFLDRNRRILIFDEPTAHLDIETELDLKERMLPLMEGRLVLFATHRLHWLQDMDSIITIDGGRIVAHSSSPAVYAEASGGTCAAIGQEDEESAAGLAVDTRSAEASSSPTACGDAMTSPGVSPASEEAQPHATHDTWVRPYFKKYRPQLAKALGLGVGAAAFSALLMFTAGYLISATAEARGSILFYYLPIAFVQLFGIGKPLLGYFERLESHDWVFRMTSSLRVRLYKALERQVLKPGARTIGESLGLVSEDIGHIQNLYLRTVFPLVIAWALLLLAVLAVGLFDPAFAGVFLLALTVAAVGLPLLAVRSNRQTMQRQKGAKNALYETLTDDMLGSTDWVFSGRGANCVQHRIEALHAVHADEARVERYRRVNDLVATAFLGGIACLLLGWATMRFGSGNQNWIAAFVLGFFPLVESCMPLSYATMQMNTHGDSVERLNGFPPTDDSVEDAEERQMPVPSYDIHARGLEFRYEGTTRNVLDGIDLTIPAGQHLAILGSSGSGKSTLAALLRGDARPNRGFITLGGKPTSIFGDSIAQHIGIVQQDAYLFDRTLRENLCIGAPGASDEEIWDALERVQLGELVRSLPDGLETPAQEAGMRFSGGERQRIALARVLLADTPIILLDEPTVGLDPVTEQGVLDALMRTAAGKTLILITHHLQGIDAFDRVVFLENGRLELDGSPTELTATSERYQSLLAFDRAS